MQNSDITKEENNGEIISEDFDLVSPGSNYWKLEKPILLVVILIFAMLLAFGLGRLSVIKEERTQIKIDQEHNTSAVLNSINNQKTSLATPAVGEGGGRVYASKSGTKYYFEKCSSRVLDENKIWFNSEDGAISAGYSLATNCRR